jgi:hypothetical protein
MKSMIQFAGATLLAVALVGCASHRHARYQNHRYVIEEHPADRTYVREYEVRKDYRGTLHFQNNMEPRVRGKHADGLGWNTENYYLQRGY